MNQVMGKRGVGHTVSNQSEGERWVGYGGCDLQTQWSERFRLETMRTFPAALEMGIAQHTTRGEDRPLLSPIAGRVEKGFWGRGLREREWGGG